MPERCLDRTHEHRIVDEIIVDACASSQCALGCY